MKDFEKEYRNSGAYHFALRGFKRWWTDDNYRILASWVGDKDRTLDLACGDGRLCSFLKTADVIGLDSAPTGLRYARQAAAIPLVQALMKSLPFKPASFHSTVCSLSLQYLRLGELDDCLRELARVIKKGGKLLISYPNVRKDGEGGCSHAALPYGDLLMRLQRSGFRVTSARGISLPMPRRLVQWSTLPVLKIIPFLFYRISKTAGCSLRRAYHYALRCVNETPGVKEAFLE